MCWLGRHEWYEHDTTLSITDVGIRWYYTNMKCKHCGVDR